MGNVQVKRERINYYDIVKGIGILGVVWAHAKGPFTHYIMQFYMPIFFIISGLLYNEKAPVKTYIKKKVLGLYVPFIFWNLLFCAIFALRNHGSLRPVYGKMGLILLTLSKEGSLFGATWFLGALLMTTVLYKILDASIKESKGKDLILLLSFAAVTIFGMTVTLPYYLSRSLALSIYFAIGAFWKKHREDFPLMEKKCGPFVGFCFLGFLAISYYNNTNMQQNTYDYPVLFVIGALMMSYVLIYLCKWLDSWKNIVCVRVSKCLGYMGKHSMDIVIWHLVMFRIIIILQMYINHHQITLTNVLSYYPMYSNAKGWWAAYVAVGIIASLIWGKILRSGFWGKLFIKMHIA